MDGRKQFETWAEEKGTPAWLLAAARVAFAWPVGKELTETEFDQALERAGGAQILAEAPPVPATSSPPVQPTPPVEVEAPPPMEAPAPPPAPPVEQPQEHAQPAPGEAESF